MRGQQPSVTVIFVITTHPAAQFLYEMLLALEVGAAKRFPLSDYKKMSNARSRAQKLNPGCRYRLRKLGGAIYVTRMK